MKHSARKRNRGFAPSIETLAKSQKEKNTSSFVFVQGKEAYIRSTPPKKEKKEERDRKEKKRSQTSQIENFEQCLSLN